VTYRALLERLFALRRFGVRPGLDGMRALLDGLGRPERELAAVHIAGTNGKGSTAAFAEALLRADGRRTGLYTSPHLLRFTERVRVDGEELGEDEAAELGERVLAARPESTFFEVATAIAFLAFRARGVEVAVIEAGLGGRLDSTNVIERPLATVVTGIALDHADVLGPTLVDIAREKAGIFKPGAPAVLACDDAGARAELERVARAVGAPLVRLGVEIEAARTPDGLRYRGPGGPLDTVPLGLDGAHQARNAALALAALASTPLAPSDAARRRGLGAARWPGRLERLAPDLLVDAAHNPDGARVLASELRQIAAGRGVALVFGAVADKDAAGMLAELAPLADAIVLTRPPSPRALDPEALRPLAPGARVVPDPAAALAAARRPGGLAVVCGSLFLVGQVRGLVLGERADPIVVQDPAAAPEKL
jgi:dihydrofolate synthase/folylpolyglutamate synthase